MKQSQVAISSNVRNFHSDTGEPCLCLLGPWRALAGPGFGMVRPADTRKMPLYIQGGPKKLSLGLIAAYQRKNQLYSKDTQTGHLSSGAGRESKSSISVRVVYTGWPKKLSPGYQPKITNTHCY